MDALGPVVEDLEALVDADDHALVGDERRELVIGRAVVGRREATVGRGIELHAGAAHDVEVGLVDKARGPAHRAIALAVAHQARGGGLE